MFQEVIDLKEALRLTVASPLAQQMGVQAEREGDLRVMLAYLHPSSSSETDFLFIHGGGGKGRGFKRKRGQPKIIYAGMPLLALSCLYICILRWHNYPCQAYNSLHMMLSKALRWSSSLRVSAKAVNAAPLQIMPLLMSSGKMQLRTICNVCCLCYLVQCTRSPENHTMPCVRKP